MYDIAPDHAIGLLAGLIAAPLAILAVRLSRMHRALPGTVQIACVLMAVTAVIHLALIPHHLGEDPITAVLFLGNGIAFLALAAAPRWRWWRLASSAMLVATILGYLFYVDFRVEGPDQVGLATKLVEFAALGMVLVPVRDERPMRDRSWYWALLATGLPLLLLVSGSGVWVEALAHPDTRHVHAGALLQSTNSVPSAEQQAAATQLYEQTAAAIAPYEDWHVAWAAGYRPAGSVDMPSTHWFNKAYEKGPVMDPRHPQGLVYANTHHGPVLLGAMFQMPRIGQFGPDPGGPLTAWHQHENICFSIVGLEFSLMTPYATCPVGAIDLTAPAMLHVWIVDNPTGGPFAVDIDPKVVAALDRT
ncbi:MAG TPA: hypothetical protein VFL29_09045 [Candidatus Dormibacteraeota bacterium]|nr:hypothetical protein [Candidatus Dormibacteraeota bacterium]